MKYVAIVLTFIISIQVTPQPAIFAGYDDFCGIRVIVTRNPQNASVSINQHGPAIYVDPSFMSKWTMSRIFTLGSSGGI